MYMPSAEGKFPVILVRTPYDNNNERDRKAGIYFAQRGYIYVVQDVRGRGDSEGIFYPIRNEANDGFDTQEWLGAREWCNGKIGSIGASYRGLTQVLAADTKERALCGYDPSGNTSRSFPQLSYSKWCAFANNSTVGGYDRWAHASGY